MKTLGDYKIHPLANKLPMMGEKEFAVLKENIRTQGLMRPIITTNKKPVSIIDGRNRLKACEELYREAEFITIREYLEESTDRRARYLGELTGLAEAEETGDFEEIIKQVILIENVYRRHLNDFQRFLDLKAVEGQHKKTGPKNSPDSGLTLSEAAEKLGKSRSIVAMMNWLDENAPEDVREALINGELSVSGAYDKAKGKDKKAANRNQSKGSSKKKQTTDFDQYVTELTSDMRKVTKKLEDLSQLMNHTKEHSRYYGQIKVDKMDAVSLTTAMTTMWGTAGKILLRYGNDPEHVIGIFNSSVEREKKLRDENQDTNETTT